MLSLKVLGVLLPALVVLTQGQNNFVEYYKWKWADYNFPPGQEPTSEEFMVENAPITGLKIAGDLMYLSTPRLRKAVPVTLSTVPYNRWRMGNGFFGSSRGPKLTPFPSYDMQKVGNCTAIQNVLAMEVDEFQRLWVVDTGRSSILEEQPNNSCPARLIVFDTKKNRRTNPEGKNILFTYEFPDDVVSGDSNIIKDIQVACSTLEDCWVYISDLAASRLVVYNTAMKKSWTVTHESMQPDPEKTIIDIDGEKAEVGFGLTGLGLSPRATNFSTLYYSPLAGDKVYRVETAILQNQPATNNNLTDDDVQLFGPKPGQSDGNAMNNRGQLFYGVLPEDSVYVTDTGADVQEMRTQTNVAKSREQLSWPDTFSFDGKGNLLLTSTRFQLWMSNKLNYTGPNDYNYRVIMLTYGRNQQPYNSV